MHVRYDSNSSLCLIYQKKSVESYKCASINQACWRWKLQCAKRVSSLRIKFLLKIADEMSKKIPSISVFPLDIKSIRTGLYWPLQNITRKPL